MAHTENSGEGGVPFNSQSTYTTRNSLAAGDIIESNKAMLSSLSEALQETLTFMGTQLHEHSKCQMEQVIKLTEAVTQMTSLHNANKLVPRSTAHTMRRIVAFIMKPTWQLPFCLIRRPHYLQRQQQVSQKMIS